MASPNFIGRGEGIFERSSLASSEERFLVVSTCFCLLLLVEKLSELTGARRKSVPPFFFYFEGQVAVRFSFKFKFQLLTAPT